GQARRERIDDNVAALRLAERQETEDRERDAHLDHFEIAGDRHARQPAQQYARRYERRDGEDQNASGNSHDGRETAHQPAYFARSFFALSTIPSPSSLRAFISSIHCAAIGSHAFIHSALSASGSVEITLRPRLRTAASTSALAWSQTSPAVCE